MNNPPHISILENEMAAAFASSSLKVFVDGTIGAGGHAKRILEEHPEIDFFLGLDQDPEALAIAAERLKPWKDKVHLVHSNFVHFERHLKKHNIEFVDGFFLTWECPQCN